MLKRFKIILPIFLVSSLYATDGATLVKNNGCLSCHAIASKKTAPAFAGIARRNTMMFQSNAKQTIIHTIQNGSHGKYPMFSNNTMPSFKNFNNGELNSIAEYILSQASKAKRHGGMGKGCN